MDLSTVAKVLRLKGKDCHQFSAFSSVKIFTLKFLVQNIPGIVEDEPCLSDCEKIRKL